jgi:thioredoxin
MNKSIKIAIVFVLVVAVVATMALKKKDKVEANETKALGILPRLVDLGADKCIPCKAMAPILEGLKEEYAGVFSVEFIDVWKNPNAGGEYGVKIIPTQIFFDAGGKELFRHEGFFSRENILAKWKELDIDIEKKLE